MEEQLMLDPDYSELFLRDSALAVKSVYDLIPTLLSGPGLLLFASYTNSFLRREMIQLPAYQQARLSWFKVLFCLLRNWEVYCQISKFEI